MEYWSGKKIEKLKENEIFVFGSNPQGFHGAGGAKAAISFGAIMGQGRGLMGQSYGLVTKNLTAGFTEKATGILYDKDGYCSVSKDQIKANIDELYDFANKSENVNKKFLITFQYETWPNGTPKKSLNGYTSEEMFQMFVRDNIPENIVFHDSYKKKLEEHSKKNIHIEKKEYTYFFNLTSPFSNFHPSLIKYKDFTFLSNEHFFMFSKAKFFKDEETANKILNIYNEFMIEESVFKNEEEKLCYQLSSNFLEEKITRKDILNNPNFIKAWNEINKKIKNLGRQVKNYDDILWNEKRENNMSFGVNLKFTQNEDLKQILLNTGNTYMIEASPYDKHWGAGLSEYDCKRIPEEKWPGKNLLGKILDKTKNKLKINLIHYNEKNKLK